MSEKRGKSSGEPLTSMNIGGERDAKSLFLAQVYDLHVQLQIFFMKLQEFLNLAMQLGEESDYVLKMLVRTMKVMKSLQIPPDVVSKACLIFSHQLNILEEILDAVKLIDVHTNVVLNEYYEKLAHINSLRSTAPEAASGVFLHAPEHFMHQTLRTVSAFIKVIIQVEEKKVASFERNLLQLSQMQASITLRTFRLQALLGEKGKDCDKSSTMSEKQGKSSDEQCTSVNICEADANALVLAQDNGQLQNFFMKLQQCINLATQLVEEMQNALKRFIDSVKVIKSLEIIPPAVVSETLSFFSDHLNLMKEALEEVKLVDVQTNVVLNNYQQMTDINSLQITAPEAEMLQKIKRNLLKNTESTFVNSDFELTECQDYAELLPGFITPTASEFELLFMHFREAAIRNFKNV